MLILYLLGKCHFLNIHVSRIINTYRIYTYIHIDIIYYILYIFYIIYISPNRRVWLSKVSNMISKTYIKSFNADFCFLRVGKLKPYSKLTLVTKNIPDKLNLKIILRLHFRPKI